MDEEGRLTSESSLPRLESFSRVSSLTLVFQSFKNVHRSTPTSSSRTPTSPLAFIPRQVRNSSSLG